MNKRTISQGLAGILMAVVGVIGCWVVYTSNQTYGSYSSRDWFDYIVTYGFLGFSAVIGLWGLALAIATINDPDGEIPGFLRAYSEAWRKLMGQRWLLWLAGSLALVNVLAILLEFGLSWHFIGGQLHGGQFGGQTQAAQLPMILNLSRSLLLHVIMVPGFFLLSGVFSDSVSTLGISALFLLALLPWVGRRLRSMGDQPEYSDAARFVRSLILPVALICIVVVAGEVYLRWYTYVVAAKRVVASDSMAVFWKLSIAHAVIAQILVSVILSAALTAGLACSLGRSAAGERVDDESFLACSVRFFKPIAGIFLLANIIPFVSLLSPILLMFAPFVVVATKTSAWNGILGSLKAWKDCGYNLLSFTALAITGLTVMTTLIGIVPKLLPHSLWMQAIWSIFTRTVVCFAVVYMVVSILEFYSQIKANADEYEAETVEAEPV